MDYIIRTDGKIETADGVCCDTLLINHGLLHHMGMVARNNISATIAQIVDDKFGVCPWFSIELSAHMRSYDNNICLFFCCRYLISHPDQIWVLRRISGRDLIGIWFEIGNAQLQLRSIYEPVYCSSLLCAHMPRQKSFNASSLLCAIPLFSQQSDQIIIAFIKYDPRIRLIGPGGVGQNCNLDTIDVNNLPLYCSCTWGCKSSSVANLVLIEDIDCSFQTGNSLVKTVVIRCCDKIDAGILHSRDDIIRSIVGKVLILVIIFTADTDCLKIGADKIRGCKERLYLREYLGEVVLPP